MVFLVDNFANIHYGKKIDDFLVACRILDRFGCLSIANYENVAKVPDTMYIRLQAMNVLQTLPHNKSPNEIFKEAKFEGNS